MITLQIQADTASLLRSKVLLGHLDGQCQGGAEYHFPGYIVPSGDSTNSATAIHRIYVLGVQASVDCPRSHIVIVQPGTRHSFLNGGTDHFFSRTGPQYLPLGCSWAFKIRVECPKERLTGMQNLCLWFAIADVRGNM
jgi:hypothetical protein